ncbi:hypothetical protein SESBI_12565 [Sesbania bispinosa]|nr:hypothetical protein SESBI_12565 [Sesbania bispinosa]
MAQEDQNRSWSNNDGGGSNGGLGRSSKKPKKKKAPQRGLGVAQLEKIRLEEQQGRDAAAILPSPSPVSSTKSSYLSDPINIFHHSNQPSSTTPLPGPPPEFIRPPLSLQQHMDAKVLTTVPLANSGGFEGSWPPVSVPGHGNVPQWWNSNKFDFENDGYGVKTRLPFLPSLPFEPNPICPLPNWVQRTQQYNQQPASSMVNISSGTSSTPMLYFSKEPPSNQNYSGSGVPVRQEEKMIGMKRPYPFSLDFPHVPTLNYKLPTFAETRTNAKIPVESGTEFNFDAANSTSREVQPCSASNSESNLKNISIGIKGFDGHFLTLAPPTPISYLPSLSNSSASLHNQECPELESPSCQGTTEDQRATPAGYRGFNQQKQLLYSPFLPPAKEAQVGQTTAIVQNFHEVEESLDLSLKL